MITKRTNRVNNLASLLEKKVKSISPEKNRLWLQDTCSHYKGGFCFFSLRRNVVNDSFILVKSTPWYVVQSKIMSVKLKFYLSRDAQIFSPIK